MDEQQYKIELYPEYDLGREVTYSLDTGVKTWIIDIIGKNKKGKDKVIGVLKMDEPAEIRKLPPDERQERLWDGAIGFAKDFLGELNFDHKFPQTREITI